MRSEALRPSRPDGVVRVFVIAGEHSGDQLGGKLLAALRRRLGSRLVLGGLGAEKMEEQGLAPMFPMTDVAVMGPLAILKRLPRIVRRVYQTVDAAIAFAPDVLVIIDSPDFTHPIARRVRRRRPDIPIVDYVSPTVWAWRPGRARRMSGYVDHLLALLPFEPEAHQRLGGPPCTYVGHPLVERRDWIAAQDGAALARRLGIASGTDALAVLPGSRINVVNRLLPVLGETVARLTAMVPPFEVVIPVVPAVREAVAAAIAGWPVRTHLVEGEADKFAAFRLARAALAASGTVALELAVAGTPMVVTYRVDPLAARLQFLVKVPSFVLPNLILGRNAFPELMQDRSEPVGLSAAVAEVMRDGPARLRQLEALAGIGELLAPHASSPSDAAAEIVLALARGGAGKPMAAP